MRTLATARDEGEEVEHATTVEAPPGGAHRRRAAPPRRSATLRPGAATGIGSLPHRSVHDAAAFALREYDVPAIPTCPAARRPRG